MSDKTTIPELPVASTVAVGDSVIVQQSGTTKQSTVSTLIAALGSIASVAWANITGKPSTFAPSAHVHPESEVTNLVTDLAAKATTASLTTHTANVSNPHAVTKAQVGLGSADNTADSAKPISTAQQAALDAKVAGPASATNDRVALFNGSTGKLIKEGTLTMANVLARANHTGQQAMSTISDAGDSATRNIGTIAGTVAAGDDSRITGAAQKTANLTDLSSASTARAAIDVEYDVDVMAYRAELTKFGLQGSNIASAATIDLGAASGHVVFVTGTTGITAIASAIAGTVRYVRFTGILTLTHNAVSLILPGAANITTAAGDCAVFICLGGVNWWVAIYEIGGTAGSFQPLDADLTAIGNLTPANNDVIQRKAGAWVNSTPAVVKTDLALTKSDVGLGSVDNTADTAKPVSTAQQTALNLKANTLDSALTGTTAITQAFKLTGVISPGALASDQNNYAPTNFAIATIIRLTASSAINITGIAGGVDGLVKIIHNIASFTITLKDEDGASTAANRFALTGDVSLAADAVTTIQYDGASSRWRVIGGTGSVGTADAIQAIAFAASITPAGTRGVANVGTLTGDILINNPTGSPTDGTLLSFRLVQDATGGRTITWGGNYAFGTDVTSGMFPTTASAKYEAGFRYHSADGKWRCLALARGF